MLCEHPGFSDFQVIRNNYWSIWWFWRTLLWREPSLSFASITLNEGYFTPMKFDERQWNRYSKIANFLFFRINIPRGMLEKNWLIYKTPGYSYFPDIESGAPQDE